ncbi:hypothetical protein ABZ949_02015 [Micromonospora tulbaghiae]
MVERKGNVPNIRFGQLVGKTGRSNGGSGDRNPGSSGSKQSR